jgi:hypothetical protein
VTLKIAFAEAAHFWANADVRFCLSLGCFGEPVRFYWPFQALGAVRPDVWLPQSRVRLHNRDPKGTALDREGNFVPAIIVSRLCITNCW